MPGDRLIRTDDPERAWSEERRRNIEVGLQARREREDALYQAQHDPECRQTLLARCRAKAEQQDRWYQEDRVDSERIASFAREVKAERQAARQLEERL